MPTATIARVHTFAFSGIEAVPVEVQVQISSGSPALLLVGLPDKAVGEARERMRAALSAMGLGLPPRRILINLAPAPPLDGSKALGPALARIHPWVEKAAMLVIGALAVVWALRTGNTLFGVFVGIATLGSLRNGVVRPSSERLSVIQALASAGLWALTLAVCFIVMSEATGHG